VEQQASFALLQRLPDKTYHSKLLAVSKDCCMQRITVKRGDVVLVMTLPYLKIREQKCLPENMQVSSGRGCKRGTEIVLSKEKQK
jgi:hypothetical protein